jgi:hypothetical protein
MPVAVPSAVDLFANRVVYWAESFASRERGDSRPSHSSSDFAGGEMGGKGVALMSKTFRSGERRIRVRAIRREVPDYRKLARALIELAQAQAEAEAKAEHQASEVTQNSDGDTAEGRA